MMRVGENVIDICRKTHNPESAVRCGDGIILSRAKLIQELLQELANTERLGNFCICGGLRFVPPWIFQGTSILN